MPGGFKAGQSCVQQLSMSCGAEEVFTVRVHTTAVGVCDVLCGMCVVFPHTQSHHFSRRVDNVHVSCRCCCCRRHLGMILRCARAAPGRLTSYSIMWPRSLWCCSTMSAGHHTHMCSVDLTSLPHNKQVASSETPTKSCQLRGAG